MGNNIIAVFSGRNKAMQFASYLKRFGIPNKTMNTPRELSVSCGVSVVFKFLYLSKVRDVMNNLSMSSSVRLYLVDSNNFYRPIWSDFDKCLLLWYNESMAKNIQKFNKIPLILREYIKNPVSELEFTNEFELLVAVMLSAQCTDKRVNLVTRELFKKFKSPQDFANIDVIELENLIKSCNYYKNKAKNIIQASKIILEKFNGQVPRMHEDLISLPGVGNKTANVVMAVGFGMQAFAVDTHILRISNRLGIATTDNPNKCEEKLKEIFKNEDWCELHHLLLLFGRYTCTARTPKCEGCVLKDYCKFRT